MKVGDKIHYSGDICNPRGWFVVTRITPSPYGAHLELREIPGRYSAFKEGDRHGRAFVTNERHIGDVYAGHCDPRCVTEAAFNTWLASRESACN